MKTISMLTILCATYVFAQQSENTLHLGIGGIASNSTNFSLEYETVFNSGNGIGFGIGYAFGEDNNIDASMFSIGATYLHYSDIIRLKVPIGIGFGSESADNTKLADDFALSTGLNLGFNAGIVIPYIGFGISRGSATATDDMLDVLSYGTGATVSDYSVVIYRYYLNFGLDFDLQEKFLIGIGINYALSQSATEKMTIGHNRYSEDSSPDINKPVSINFSIGIKL